MQECSPKPLFECKSLQVGYAKPLCTPLSFALVPGKIATIQGHNGSGKTTFIKTILGQLRPLSGEFSWGVGSESVSYLPQLISHDASFSYTMNEILSLYQVPKAHKAKLPSGLLPKKWIEASGGERQLAMPLTRITESTRELILDLSLIHI